MQDPLKQGLKPSIINGYIFNNRIRMQDPLKQGLKLGLPYFLYSQAFYSNARSTKTRIETEFTLTICLDPSDSNARSTKTRIET